MTVRSEETVNAVERAAAEERGVAVERGHLAADLTAARDQMAAEMEAIEQQAAWWKQRYPGDPVAALLAERHGQASARTSDAADRLADVVREQQAHEVAATELAAEAARMRSEWEAQHGAKVAAGPAVDGGRPTRAETTVPDQNGSEA